MKLIQKHEWLGSSQNPEKIAASIKGFVLLLIPVLTSIATILGLDILEADIVTFVESICAVVGTAWLSFGLGRKLYYKLKG